MLPPIVANSRCSRRSALPRRMQPSGVEPFSPDSYVCNSTPFPRVDPLPRSLLPASTGTVPNQGEANQGGGKEEANPEDGHPDRRRERHERSNRWMETRERRIHGMTGWKTNKKRVDRHRAVPTNRRGARRFGSIQRISHDDTVFAVSWRAAQIRNRASSSMRIRENSACILQAWGSHEWLQPFRHKVNRLAHIDG